MAEKKHTVAALIHIPEESMQQIASRGKKIKNMPLKSYPVSLPVGFSGGVKIPPSIDLAEYNGIDEIDLPAPQELFYRGTSSCSPVSRRKL